MAIVCGATYVARGFSGQQKHLVALIKGAIEHRDSPSSTSSAPA